MSPLTPKDLRRKEDASVRSGNGRFWAAANAALVAGSSPEMPNTAAFFDSSE
jgi:hypothetical protein